MINELSPDGVSYDMDGITKQQKEVLSNQDDAFVTYPSHTQYNSFLLTSHALDTHLHMNEQYPSSSEPYLRGEFYATASSSLNDIYDNNDVLLTKTGFLDLSCTLNIVSYENCTTVTTVETPPQEDIKCNCWAWVKQQIPSFPNTKDLKLQQGYSHNGDVVVFDYPHYAIQVNSSDKGFWVKDSNWKKCTLQTHFISWNDPHIRGYWSPQ